MSRSRKPVAGKGAGAHAGAPAKRTAPDLAQVRAQIDEIDLRIQELIGERARWAQQVGKAKGPLKAAVDYYRPEREAQVLRRIIDRNDGPLSDAEIVRLFREIMSACLAQQQPLKIGFLGPNGTFSEQAARKHFGHSAHGLPLASIEEVFTEVESGNADFGVVPVENSGQGTIQVTLDMFLTSKARICGEVELRVHQYLLSRSGQLADIERVYSHPQSLAQCQAWLRQHLPKAERVPVSSNAEAARRARNADDAAAIAGEAAGHVYHLKAVAGPIEDRPDNTTRFLVIGRELFPPSGNDRTSLLVFVKDQPGALYEVLRPFAEHGVSMNRIESRPSHQGLWQYAFFIDFEGHVEDAPVRAALAELERHAAQVRVLGSYPLAIV
ncbi:prephenate dehydratase [Pseudofulvimonas gallinarii]|uniref:Bifunctional chorismate mutase/prephenate dehydratase n=1 Tax=Pseudofulvimonas gallinarii TaxID=634155 RepID=A0A4S3KYT4_9GAMM|nr:prephenate dehydratase [Pseudofulvimonas gallinarii]TCS94523.1 chorismate mutase [Pseudofulvimonas gallinarii]THD14562.1 chorismate mutase [Pseudofulvimonas gallinarii]